MANRWNKFITDVRRSIGECEYFAAKEAQKRGALHIHTLVRFDAPSRVRLSKLRALAIRHGFGHEVDLQELTDTKAQEATARYVSKYVTKASTAREEVPYVHRVTGEIGPGKWRTWTSSRSWGSSMLSVRMAQRQWWSQGVAYEGPGGRPGEAWQAEGRTPDLGGPGVAEGGPLDPNTERYAGTSSSSLGGVVPV